MSNLVNQNPHLKTSECWQCSFLRSRTLQYTLTQALKRTCDNHSVLSSYIKLSFGNLLCPRP